MTDTSTDTSTELGKPQRLHPFSWLFVLITRLRPFLLPAILLVFFGMGSSWEMWGIPIAVLIALYALIYSFSFRYQIENGELVIKEGVIFRTERHVPFVRVQSVVQRRNALHLLFGVTELRLESAGGTRPEAVMNVVSVDEAQRLERVLRSASATAEQPTADSSAAVSETPTTTGPLFRLTTAEVLRLGLISNRGWIVVGMFFGLYWQFAPEDHSLSKLIGGAIEKLFDLLRTNPQSALAGLFWVIPAILAFGLLLKPLSMLMTWLMFHGFRLTRGDGRLSTVSGLLTRRTASARSDRIQRLVAREPVLARMLGRRTLSCDVAIQRQTKNDEMSRLHWLAPIATPGKLHDLVSELAPAMAFEPRKWQPLHPDAWKRQFKQYILLALIAAAVLFWPLQYLAFVPPLVILIYGWFASRGWAKFAAYSHDGTSLAFRAGWVTREWTTALIANGHVVSLKESPFDRRRGMASIGLDTPGASKMLFPLRVPYLPVETARSIHRAISERMASADLRSIPKP